MAQTILIVDDDPTQRRLMESVVERGGYKVITADGGKSALEILTGQRGQSVSLMLLDLVMPDLGGFEVLAELPKAKPGLPVIVLTAQGGIDTVVSAMRAGAADFVVKPASPERLLVSVENAIKLGTLTGEVQRLKRKSSNTLTFDDLIGKAPAMQQVTRLGRRAAQSNIPILIEGESGVGKELIARAIQGESERSGKPFVAVNCGALPENLVESILFGHKKGAFTGANDEHAGKFQEANGGTLFLDEIGELRLDIQVKLLRAIQEGEVDPIGSNKPVKVDIRLISATNRNLLKMAETGDFREDLYYRLNVFPVFVPPLRERREDIADLLEFFAQRFAAEEGKKVSGIEPASLEALSRYNWPGNVRQLENTVFRAVVLAEGDWLTLHDFPQVAAQLEIELADRPIEVPVPPTQTTVAAQPTDTAGAVAEVLGAIDGSTAASSSNDGAFASAPQSFGIPAGVELPAAAAPPQPGSGLPIIDPAGHLRPLDEIEGEMIRIAIERYDGHMSEVARRLGIGRSTLYRKVRDLGLDVRGDE